MRYLKPYQWPISLIYGGGLGVALAYSLPPLLAVVPLPYRYWLAVAVGIAPCFIRSNGRIFTLRLKNPIHLTSIAPAVVIAFAFGLILSGTGTSSIPSEMWWWTVAVIPFYEEGLFRGFLYQEIAHLSPQVSVSPTNPQTLAAWISAAAFAGWHGQNLAVLAWPLVLLQIGYSFVAGLWLARLREKTASLLPSIIAHAALNAATLLGIRLAMLK